MPEYFFSPATKAEIQIDWDAPLAPIEQYHAWRKYGYVRCHKSKSGNMHISIFCPKYRKLGNKQKIILAAALGDDPIRAKLNMRRARFL